MPSDAVEAPSVVTCRPRALAPRHASTSLPRRTDDRNSCVSVSSLYGGRRGWRGGTWFAAGHGDVPRPTQPAAPSATAAPPLPPLPSGAAAAHLKAQSSYRKVASSDTRVDSAASRVAALRDRGRGGGLVKCSASLSSASQSCSRYPCALPHTHSGPQRTASHTAAPLLYQRGPPLALHSPRRCRGRARRCHAARRWPGCPARAMWWRRSQLLTPQLTTFLQG